MVQWLAGPATQITLQKSKGCDDKNTLRKGSETTSQTTVLINVSESEEICLV